METCSCGLALRRYWIWRDEAGMPHASAFEPAIRSEESFFAVNAHDALCPVGGSRLPKHDVQGTGGQVWQGLCRVDAVQKVS